jgi:hypothetical protein
MEFGIKNVRLGHNDDCGQFIIHLRSPQKVEWRFHHDFPSHPKTIQIFGQKEIQLRKNGPGKSRK